MRKRLLECDARVLFDDTGRRLAEAENARSTALSATATQAAHSAAQTAHALAHYVDEEDEWQHPADQIQECGPLENHLNYFFFSLYILLFLNIIIYNSAPSL